MKLLLNGVDEIIGYSLVGTMNGTIVTVKNESVPQDFIKSFDVAKYLYDRKEKAVVENPNYAPKKPETPVSGTDLVEQLDTLMMSSAMIMTSVAKQNLAGKTMDKTLKDVIALNAQQTTVINMLVKAQSQMMMEFAKLASK